LTALDNGAWMAGGWTWDRDGLHFDQMASLPASERTSTGRRDSIWRSLPEGMALVGCVERHAIDWRSLGSTLRLGAAAGAASATELAGVPASGWPSLDRAWMGDAVGVAVRGVEATPLAPIPDLALVVEVHDAAAAAADLHVVEAQLAGLPVGGFGSGFTDVHYGGRTYRTLVQPFSERVSPSWVVDGDVAVLATTRSLLEQILDTRRTGRRSARSDDAFRRFERFAPNDAGAVFYANERRVHDAVQKLREAHGLWGPRVERGIATIEQWSSVAAHFPSGVAYLAHQDSTIVLRGWMSEAD
jgi:hypothetical protein